MTHFTKGSLFERDQQTALLPSFFGGPGPHKEKALVLQCLLVATGTTNQREADCTLVDFAKGC